MRVDVFDSMEWLYPDSQVRTRPRRRARMESARNARPGFQVLLTHIPEGAPISAEVSTLKRAGGGRLTGARAYHLRSVPVEENTGITAFTTDGDKNPHVTRQAPFRVFDVLRPLSHESRAEPGANVILVQVRVPYGARPGSYAGSVELRAGGRRAEVPVQLTVHAARVPRQMNLKVTNWFSVELMAKRHGLKAWSKAHWEMIRRYVDLMIASRQNMLWAPLGFVEANRGQDGRWRFDLRRWERLIRLYLEAGARWIEGGHLAMRKDWGDERHHLHGQPDVLATDGEGYAFLAAFLPELMRVIKRNGWQDCYIQHVADEPLAASASDYRILCGIVRRFMLGIPLMDAEGSGGLWGALDIHVPVNAYFERDRDDYARHSAAGDEIWHYTCCVPGGPYLNRLLDQPLLCPRLLHWGNHLYDLKGYLHWGLNHYRPEQDPFEQSVTGPPGHRLPAGDTHVVYPGTDGPWSGMRLEAMREGIEDYELLAQVARRDRKLADRICRRSFRGFSDYTRDVAAFRRAHRKLLEAADGAP